MTEFQTAFVLLGINIGLLWLLLAAPIGSRTIKVRRLLNKRAEEIWDMARPGGGLADWHPAILSSRPVEGMPDRMELTYRQPDRQGRSMTRIIAIDRTGVTAQGEFSCELRIVADSALDAEFWSGYREVRRIAPAEVGSAIVIEQTDSYRGLAGYLYRYFSLRREVRALEDYLEGRKPVAHERFEHPLVQTALAVLSTLLLWPFFGMNSNGLMISVFLTLVIVFHELGHMVAYRAFGHESARMIFVPLLGGIAIGGRPYDSRFEAATCALMGAGVSAFLVPILIAAHQSGPESGPILVFMLILGAFNLLNLLPMYRFDGGQMLRQIFRTTKALTLASFGVTGVILWTGWRIGLPPLALLAALSIFTLLSLIRTGKVKPRHELAEMSPAEQLMTGFGLYAALSIHVYAVVYACDRLFG
ncbi:hypothetical protein G6N76_09155 [Rhizobium daejeonense]|uniref:Site-2 protease family protein n=1 Tax=Rhizobium daejeonense TaxID=240521 RepID=A0A6M1RR89_9HYPH|nr:hypothetical protein [Rhizobium daejeonense]NGO63842.1 hypothetical protein [Rhizobium daejeonense]